VSSPKEMVRKAVCFQGPERVPRDCWVLPWAAKHYPEEVAALREEYPMDFAEAGVELKKLPHMKSDRHSRGESVDEWGCRWINIQEGAIGEVKEPLIATWGDLGRARPPYEALEGAFDRVDENCAATDRFVLGAIGTIFERMQHLRTTEQLFVDLMEQPRELFMLRDLIHEFNLTMLEKLAATAVDGMLIGDDWGAQNALLMPPTLWREFFKPCYAEYVDLAHRTGKFFFVHSDGHIMEIYEDLIEIGVDAINSQLFCMDIEEIARRFKGRICFWGEIDRQHVLPSPDVSDVTSAVARVVDALYDPAGGVVAQCEYGLATRPENVRELYAAWERFTSVAT